MSRKLMIVMAALLAVAVAAIGATSASAVPAPLRAVSDFVLSVA